LIPVEPDPTVTLNRDQHSVFSICSPQGNRVRSLCHLYGQARCTSGRIYHNRGGEQEHRDERKHDACESDNVNPANEPRRFRVFLAHPHGQLDVSLSRFLHCARITESDCCNQALRAQTPSMSVIGIYRHLNVFRPNGQLICVLTL